MGADRTNRSWFRRSKKNIHSCGNWAPTLLTTNLDDSILFRNNATAEGVPLIPIQRTRSHRSHGGLAQVPPTVARRARSRRSRPFSRVAFLRSRGSAMLSRATAFALARSARPRRSVDLRSTLAGHTMGPTNRGEPMKCTRGPNNNHRRSIKPQGLYEYNSSPSVPNTLIDTIGDGLETGRNGALGQPEYFDLVLNHPESGWTESLNCWIRFNFQPPLASAPLSFAFLAKEIAILIFYLRASFLN